MILYNSDCFLYHCDIGNLFEALIQTISRSKLIHSRTSNLSDWKNQHLLKKRIDHEKTRRLNRDICSSLNSEAHWQILRPHFLDLWAAFIGISNHELTWNLWSEIFARRALLMQKWRRVLRTIFTSSQNARKWALSTNLMFLIAPTNWDFLIVYSPDSFTILRQIVICRTQ